MTDSEKKLDEQKKELINKVNNLLEQLDNQLKKAELWPVTRKVYNMIEGRLRILKAALLSPTCTVNEGLVANISDALIKVKPNLYELRDYAWDAADSLKELLPMVAQDEYLYKALLEERGREERLKDDSVAFHPWRHYFGAESLNDHILKYEKKVLKKGEEENFDDYRSLVVNRLTFLYQIRNQQGLHDRAREGIRTKYLIRMAYVLTTTVALASVLWLYANGWSCKSFIPLTITFMSGAIGALLARSMRLRDLNVIVELTSAWKTMAFQAVLGSTLAVIVLLILKSNIISIAGWDVGNDNKAVFFVIGLISGFSEPFALGILDRIAAMGKEQ